MKMEKIIDVSTGSVKVGRAGVMLRSSAIGSCIVIAAYDLGKKIGALAHIMLPGRSLKGSKVKRTKYAADAIDEMIHRLSRLGSSRNDIEVCMVGGANVLRKGNDTISKENIDSALEFLGEKQLKVRGQAIGGTSRRSVRLDVESGKIFYTEGEGKEKLLWKSTRKLR